MKFSVPTHYSAVAVNGSKPAPRPEPIEPDWELMHAQAVVRMSAFDRLPYGLREAINDGAAVPDLQHLRALYEDAVPMKGSKATVDWLLRSMQAFEVQRFGYLPPLRIPPKRRRRTPESHKLAPSVRTMT